LSRLGVSHSSATLPAYFSLPLFSSGVGKSPRDIFTEHTNRTTDGGTFKTGAFNAEVIAFATAKVVTPAWHQVFLRAILANWLVTMAVFLSTSSREIASKIISIWFPTMAFTANGADHVIANMFYVPVGIFSGAPISVGLYIWKSMIPAALGNIIGGGVFVGVVYWYLHLAVGEEIELPFDKSPYPSAAVGQLDPALPRLTPQSTLRDVDGITEAPAIGMAKELHGSLYMKSAHNSKDCDSTA
jgi:hypothetical protein